MNPISILDRNAGNALGILSDREIVGISGNALERTGVGRYASQFDLF